MKGLLSMGPTSSSFLSATIKECHTFSWAKCYVCLDLDLARVVPFKVYKLCNNFSNRILPWICLEFSGCHG